MWIQVRTMDGRETHRVDSLSKLTKVEGLRLRIHEVFGVEPHRQRLFYRGKQVPRGALLRGAVGLCRSGGGDTVTPRGPAQRSPPQRYERARRRERCNVGGDGAGAVGGFVCRPSPPLFPPFHLECEEPRISAVAGAGTTGRSRGAPVGLRVTDSRSVARRCAPRRHQALGAGAVCHFAKFAVYSCILRSACAFGLFVSSLQTEPFTLCGPTSFDLPLLCPSALWLWNR